MKHINIKKYIRKEKGFTLAEIIVGLVIATIIGVAITSAIIQTYNTYNRNTARTEATSQVGFATEYIHQDAQQSQFVYLFDGSTWSPVTDSNEYNLVLDSFLLERPFWDINESGYRYECFIYAINQSTRELQRSHCYYNNAGSPGSPDSVKTVASNIDVSQTDDLGNPVSYNQWYIDSSTEYPNGMSFTAQITCTVGDIDSQTVSGKVEVIRMMTW